MTDTPPPSDTPAPPGAISVDNLFNGLRGQLQKGEHVLWQGRGSGRAFNALGRGFLLRIALLGVAGILAVFLMLDNRSTTYNWVAWALFGLLVARVALFVWQSSATPARQVAMLTTERVISIDMLRPMTNWTVTHGGEGKSDGKHFPPQPIVVTGTKERGHIRLNNAPQNARVYPPFVLYNAERPLEVAEKIKKTLKIDQPIVDRTK